MARQLRMEYEGAHYHVTSRGNERKAVFRDNNTRSSSCYPNDEVGGVQVHSNSHATDGSTVSASHFLHKQQS